MKARIRKTGETVDVICHTCTTARVPESDTVSYIDSEGREHHKEMMNYYWDMEELPETATVEKDQAKWELIKAMLPTFVEKFTVKNEIIENRETKINYDVKTTDAFKSTLQFVDEIIKGLEAIGII